MLVMMAGGSGGIFMWLAPMTALLSGRTKLCVPVLFILASRYKQLTVRGSIPFVIRLIGTQKSISQVDDQRDGTSCHRMHIPRGKDERHTDTQFYVPR